MRPSALLITPPFTQLNTPYPATAYLNAILKEDKVSTLQCDLGIEVILKLFSERGLKKMFQAVDTNDLSENSLRIHALKDEYINTIDAAITFLQGKNSSLAYRIIERGFLPEASKFSALDNLDWEFGKMGTQDKAKHLATLYLEDLGDYISENIDSHFGFSRYAEHLARSANSFNILEEELSANLSYIDMLLIELLEEKIQTSNPTLVALSIPFPGNLLSGLRCGQWIKKNRPNIKIALGGGFANTELRSLSDTRIFNYVDFISLDDGEIPLKNILEHVDGKRTIEELKRTFVEQNGLVVFMNGSKDSDAPFHKTGTPDYSDLPLEKYISVIEVANPMQSLWSNGRWNKITLAHGCYWGRCTFCDTSLDYIKQFEPQSAKQICDKIEKVISETGETGFHFVDEAAPPALLKELALEIIRRRLQISWWGNIRFEKNFSYDLCRLLKVSGCIAVSGGLEVASDRLLSIINKGVKVEQVARVSQHFTDNGIMVHAYLMYGFPTQTDQETIDSLEVVRQLFMHGVVKSGFWHLFTMTEHSPIGLKPEQFQVERKSELIGTFANNDVPHIDQQGTDHEKYSSGLKKALYNFMHDVGFDLPLSDWFDFKVPKTIVNKHLIENALDLPEHPSLSPRSKVCWIGIPHSIRFFTKSKKGKTNEMAELYFFTNTDEFAFITTKLLGEWISNILNLIAVDKPDIMELKAIEESYKSADLGDFDLFITGREFKKLREIGLLIL